MAETGGIIATATTLSSSNPPPIVVVVDEEAVVVDVMDGKLGCLLKSQIYTSVPGPRVSPPQSDFGACIVHDLPRPRVEFSS